MATITVLDSTGATQTVQVPNPNGVATSANSKSVVIASDQSAVPVSAAGLPLPTGASTETTLVALSGKHPATLGQKAMAASLAVTVASDQSTIPVSNASLPLPIGAATETTLAGQSAKLPATVGQKAMAASLAVVLPSDQPAVLALGAVADAAWTTGSGSQIALLKAIATAATDTTTASPVKIDQTTDGVTNRANVVPASTAHALIAAPSTYRLLSSAATTNGANIKTTSGTIKGIQGYNAKASAVYLKLYNKASAPTVGTDTPVKTIYLPSSAAFAFDFGTGVAFATGLSIALTGAITDADTTALVAGDILALNVDYH